MVRFCPTCGPVCGSSAEPRCSCTQLFVEPPVSPVSVASSTATVPPSSPLSGEKPPVLLRPTHTSTHTPAVHTKAPHLSTVPQVPAHSLLSAAPILRRKLDIIHRSFLELANVDAEPINRTFGALRQSLSDLQPGPITAGDSWTIQASVCQWHGQVAVFLKDACLSEGMHPATTQIEQFMALSRLLLR
eukprot:TRINITY_DN9632_c0_g1_i1.p1 TRINITY_DN9632_c0_g1~~TRINITY_DN9632_c0_g1_i1.p1  ORF type:complete len:195 (+),score=14.77 TRINITY_DN9632_c0_g1_i1:22-585(+)